LVQALHNAMEIATRNVPVIEGDIVICPDVSGSMGSPITGQKKVGKKMMTVATKVRCVDVAALMTACLLRKNPSARVLPYEGEVVDLKRRGIYLEGRDTIMTNAQKLASIHGGSTNCAAPLNQLVKEGAHVDGVIFISDYESWQNSEAFFQEPQYHGRTEMAVSWAKLQAKNKNAKLICNDVTPTVNIQVNPNPNVLLVGGFSDEVFNVAHLFLGGKLAKEQWLQQIEAIELSFNEPFVAKEATESPEV
jgi:60 kDa SS-A/Ro ribonucleoprotein